MPCGLRPSRLLYTIVATLLGLHGLNTLAKNHHVTLNVTPSHRVIEAGQQRTVYLKVGLTGFEMKKSARSPANIAIVLDKSGSMDGPKLARAKDAAIMALERLNSDDYASVVAYSGTVEVIYPASEVTDKYVIASAIRGILPNGPTALFAGVSKGADQVRTYFNRNQINRVILLSDGKANVGPRSPYELGMLASSLQKEGISVTTIGLGPGYNEDLMETLARKSGGNHAFAEKASHLAKIFQNEFNDFLSVVGQNAQIRISCTPGIVPISVLGHRARINGNTILVDINQIYSKQEKYIIVELKIPPQAPNQRINLATISASYNNMYTKQNRTVSHAVAIQSSDNNASVQNNVNKSVMSSTIEFIAIQRNERAIELRDQGRTNEAKLIFLANEKWLRENAKKYDSSKLIQFANIQADSARNISGPDNWNLTRKRLKNDLYRRETQQSY